MLILGIDPGYAIIGYGVVKFENYKFTPMEYGAVTTPSKTDFSRRLEMIYDGISSILDKYSIDALAIEKLFFNTNTTTAIDVAQARGVILLAAKKHNVPLFEYTPLQVKQSVTGYGRAQKAQVMEMTRQMLSLKSVPKPDDTADALALAICHGYSASLASKLSPKGML